jgi:hypothetical protein
MEPIFNLTGLKNIYNESLDRKEQTLAFAIKEGNGLFNFVMIFSDDKESKDNLFLFFRRIDKIFELKLYGSHRNGDFKIYLNDDRKKLLIKLIIEELDITKHDVTFDFIIFLNKLNSVIPDKLSEAEKTYSKEVWSDTRNTSSDTDDANKTILYGIRKLSQKRNPQDKTLNKLYSLGDKETIRNLISALKAKNITVVWTSDINKKGKCIVEIITKLNTNKVKI